MDKIFKLTSKDHWQSAEIIEATSSEDRFHNPTTATFKNELVYILNSKMNQLSDSTKKSSEEFPIQLAKFIPAK